MGDDWNGHANGTSGNGSGGDGPAKDWRESRDEIADELERQARETVQAFKESAGELGERVRKALDHAANLWDKSGPGAPPASGVRPAEELRARALARRWKTIDFLVDPDLAEGMAVTSFREVGLWRAELRERGETRTLTEATDPYRGASPGQVTPVLPVWDYAFATTPDIESGERRERLPDSGMIGACLTCNGTGHRSCAHCEGRGFLQCPTCHGRAQVVCKRCRGRGRIPDGEAERRARASKSYLQVHAERVAADAAGRLADLSERLRQEYGVPLPPSAQWIPSVASTGETIPCPECVDGKVKCACGNGKVVCEVCRGSGQERCATCAGSGRVVRYRELVRRFDTRIYPRAIPCDDAALAALLTEPMLRRAAGERAWEGPIERVEGTAPEGVPAAIWAEAQSLAREQQSAAGDRAGEQAGDDPERRVIGRRVRLTRIPLTRVEYTFAGNPFAFLAVGAAGAERFWADTFPPRWSRVRRFFKALVRDLGDLGSEASRTLRGPADIAHLEEYRARKAGAAVQRVQILEEPAGADGPETAANPTPPKDDDAR